MKIDSSSSDELNFSGFDTPSQLKPKLDSSSELDPNEFRTPSQGARRLLSASSEDERHSSLDDEFTQEERQLLSTLTKDEKKMIGITSTDEEIVQGARRLLSSSEEDEGQIFKEPKDTNRPSKGASKAKKTVSNAIKQFQGSSKQKKM